VPVALIVARPAARCHVRLRRVARRGVRLGAAAHHSPHRAADVPPFAPAFPALPSRRQTGGLSRAIERGTNAVEQLLRLAVFNIIPTLLEVLMVTTSCGSCSTGAIAALTFASIFLYLSFTLTVHQLARAHPRAMNETDSEAQSPAIDSLLNYETVKYFGQRGHEAKRFDEAWARYERAAVRSQVTLNLLNLGQAASSRSGWRWLMLLAADGVADAA